MLLRNAFIMYMLIQLYIFIKSLKVKNTINFRFLNETNITNILSEINNTNILSEINNTNILSEINNTNILSEINNTNNFYTINSTNKLSEINETNFISEMNKTNSSLGINNTNNINGTNIEGNETEIIIKNCFSYLDCFNCTINKYCRWSWTNESCIEYIPFNENFSIPDLNNSLINDDIFTINPFINFLRKACFKSYTPYKENNSSLLYNNISKKYCGPHEITTHTNNYLKDFKIELNNINGTYGAQNILCEYIFLSGPNSFQINIEINEKYNKSFYLLYSEHSIYFYDLFKESTTITIDNTGRRANTFIYYGLNSFKESPFKITFKEIVYEESSQTTGYIFIALIILIFILVVVSIIYIRYNSKLFNKNKKFNDPKSNITEEEEKIREKSDFNFKIINNKQINNIGNNKQNNQEIINNINEEKKSPNTPDNLLTKKLEKQFTFDNYKINNNFDYFNEMNKCCYDFQVINNISDIYKAKCGHSYHTQCFNKLIEQNIHFLGNKILKCVYCQQIIYP